MTPLSTKTVQLQNHCLVYGPTKIGKTRLIPTCPQPFVISTDEGLASIRKFDIPFLPARSAKEFDAVWKWFWGGPYKNFQTLVVDDITEMAEQILLEERPRNKDGRQAYYAMQDKVVAFLHDARTKPIPVVMIAKEEKIVDEVTGGLIIAPMLAGQRLGNMLGYLVSDIYHMEEWLNPQDGKTYEVLRCKRNDRYAAGSRSGNLNELEFANLGAIFQKVMQ